MSQCFEEGIFQSFLDNELPGETAEAVAVHVAACTKCAAALDAASAESLLMSNAFEAELALDVPTVRLRERIDAAIASTSLAPKLSYHRSRWNMRARWAALTESFNLSPQRALGFATVLVLIAFAAIFGILRSNASKTEVAGTISPRMVPPAVAVATPTPATTKESDEGPEPPPQPNQQKPKRKANPVDVPEPSQLPKDELARALPGELNYLKAIDSLAVEIESSGETALKPSLRAEYERNLAVVDQAIDSTRRVARRRPGDPDAAAFLYSSYQSKLDLLTAVAEQVRPTIAAR